MRVLTTMHKASPAFVLSYVISVAQCRENLLRTLYKMSSEMLLVSLLASSGIIVVYLMYHKG